MQDETFKYWAFISYSHADEQWAQWLHRSLERYRIPSRLVGQNTAVGVVPDKLFPVFRDRDELAGSSALGPALQNALKGSRFQIVIASRKAAQSHWVNEEIRYFKSIGRADRVLALIVNGEPNAADKQLPDEECFPECLKFDVDGTGTVQHTRAEPIAADVRKGGDGKLNAKLKLISGILGVGFDDLKQRELAARNRRLALLSTLSTGVAALTILLAIFAYQARNDALRRQRQAEDLIQFMLGDLREKLEPIGKLAILDAVGNKAMDYFSTLDQSDQTDAALSSRAKALRQIGEVRSKQGDLPGASVVFDEALRLDTELVKRHPDDAQAVAHIGKSQFFMGFVHYLKGDIEQAGVWYRRYLKTTDRLLELEPKRAEWIHRSVEANSNVGAVEYQNGQLDAAYASFQIARERQAALVAQHPDNLKFLDTLALTDGWLSSVEADRQHWSQALHHANVQADLLRKLRTLAPDNAEYRLRLASALHQAIYSELAIRELAPDAPPLRECNELTAALVRLDPENIEYVRAHILSLNYRIDAALMAKQDEVATASEDTLLALARKQFKRAPEKAEVVDDLAATLIQAAKHAWLKADGARARTLVLEVIQMPLSQEQQAHRNPSRWLDLYLMAWRTANTDSDRARAREAALHWLEQARSSGAPPPARMLLAMAALQGERAEAEQQFQQLGELERRHPFIRQLCQEQKVCAEK